MFSAGTEARAGLGRRAPSVNESVAVPKKWMCRSPGLQNLPTPSRLVSTTD